MVSSILSIVIAYLLGSILPAYVIARIKGFDIRERGTRNPGISNATKTMGYKVGVIVAIYDLSKAPLSVIIARFLGAPLYICYLSGFFTILGHIAPFYLRFKGGRGLSVAVGMCFYSVVLLLLRDWKFIYILAIFLAAISLLFFIRVIKTRTSEITFVVLPLLLFCTILYFGLSIDSIVFLLAGAYIVGERIQCIWRDVLIHIKREERAFSVVRWLRAFALVFPLGIFYLKRITLTTLGVLLLVFVILEVLRFLKGFDLLPILYGSEKKRHISSIVIFLFSIFLTLFFFKENVAALAVLFLIFGEILSWSVDLGYNGIKIFGRTILGTLLGFLTCLIITAIFYKLALIGLIGGILGAVTASVLILIPMEGKYFAVPLVSAMVMTLL